MGRGTEAEWAGELQLRIGIAGTADSVHFYGLPWIAADQRRLRQKTLYIYTESAAMLEENRNNNKNKTVLKHF